MMGELMSKSILYEPLSELAQKVYGPFIIIIIIIIYSF